MTLYIPKYYAIFQKLVPPIRVTHIIAVSHRWYKCLSRGHRHHHTNGDAIFYTSAFNCFSPKLIRYLCWHLRRRHRRRCCRRPVEHILFYVFFELFRRSCSTCRELTVILARVKAYDNWNSIRLRWRVPKHTGSSYMGAWWQYVYIYRRRCFKVSCLEWARRIEKKTIYIILLL